jgi:hypothetical protein
MSLFPVSSGRGSAEKPETYGEPPGVVRSEGSRPGR